MLACPLCEHVEVNNVDEQGQLFWQPARVVELCEDGAFIACVNGEYTDQFSPEPEMDEWRLVPASERARVATGRQREGTGAAREAIGGALSAHVACCDWNRSDGLPAGSPRTVSGRGAIWRFRACMSK